jgi:hypothetical protein
VQLKQMYNCAPVFIDPDVRDKYYKGVASTRCTHQLQISLHTPDSGCISC